MPEPVHERAMLSFAPSAADPSAKQRILAATDKLDAYFSERIQTGSATGLSVGIVLGGELVYSRGFGVQDVATKTPVGPDSAFRIASLTKSFTAMAILRLRDQGRLALDAPAESYVPELSKARGPTADSPPITVRMLLTHAGGLPWDDQWGPVSFGFSDEERDALLASGISFAGVPGENYEYSNFGYALLGLIAERVTGISFRDFVTREILNPLGMTGTVWDSAQVSPGRLAVGYRVEDGAGLTPEPRIASSFFAPAGGLYTTLRDYARYMAFHLSAYPPRNEPEMAPLRRSSVRELHRGQRPWTLQATTDKNGVLSVYRGDYGFGWIESTTCRDNRRLEHSGWEPGYFSSVVLLPERSFGIVSLATTNGVRATEGAIELLRQMDALPPITTLPPTMDLQRARDSVGQLFRQWDTQFVNQIFAPDSVHYVWFRKLEASFARLRRDHGVCDFTGAVSAEGRLHGYWRASCEKGAIDFEAFLAPTVPTRVAMLSWKELLADERPPGESTVPRIMVPQRSACPE
jgi:CubicO group peptidase (beta-lactamase class C family)